MTILIYERQCFMDNQPIPIYPLNDNYFTDSLMLRKLLRHEKIWNLFRLSVFNRDLRKEGAPKEPPFGAKNATGKKS